MESLNEASTQFFAREGYLLLKGNSETINLANEICDAVNIIGRSICSNFSLDQSSLIYEMNRNGFYNAVRHIRPLYRLIASDSLCDLAVQLGVTNPAPGPSAVRLDIREEFFHQFGWHQDAPSLLGSIRMYTYWIPCTSVSSEAGSIEIIPRSHLDGLRTGLSPRDLALKNAMESSNLVLTDDEMFGAQASLVVEAEPGSVLVLHPFLIHRSYYPNSAHPCRVTAIVRLDDLGDVNHLRLGAKSALSQSNINNSPEYKTYYESNK